MYAALGANPIRIGRPAPPDLPVDQGDKTDLLFSMGRGIVALALVGGALVMLLRVAEEQERIAWRTR
jgi:hypothetical protein